MCSPIDPGKIRFVPERVFKTDYIIPLVADLNSDGTFEFIVVNENEFPFGMSAIDFEYDRNRFIHNEKQLLEIQKQKSLLVMDGMKSNDWLNTPLLVNYPIKIFNLNKYGLKDVTTKFPEFL